MLDTGGELEEIRQRDANGNVPACSSVMICKLSSSITRFITCRASREMTELISNELDANQ